MMHPCLFRFRLVLKKCKATRELPYTRRPSLLTNNEEYRGFTTSLCERAGFTPSNNFEVDSHLLAEIIKLDQGVALLPISACRTLGLHYVKITDIDPAYTVKLSWVKDRLLSPTVTGFRDFIISYFKENHRMYKVY